MRVSPSKTGKQFESGKRSSGFTLLEVMITVAIVGILAAIALPSYFEFVTRSKIIDGTNKLSNFRAAMEKYFLDNRIYVTVAGGGVCGIPDPVPVLTADYFQINCVGTDTTYVITATGIASRGMGGFVYTLTQTNAKATTSVGAPWSVISGTCWVTRKDGSC